MDFTNWLTYLVTLSCGVLCICCLWNMFRYLVIPRREFIEDDLDKWLAAGDKVIITGDGSSSTLLNIDSGKKK